uniref:synembryn-A isoform X2 n=1 Tax=Myxine glutinosa TaxID=7769 RepID=UPI00358EE470
MALGAVLLAVREGPEDAVVAALQDFCSKHAETFKFDLEDGEEGKQLASALLDRLSAPPPCSPLVIPCLSTARLLSRDPFIGDKLGSLEALKILSQHAGIWEQEPQEPATSTEALKCLCNVVFNCGSTQANAVEMKMEIGLLSRLESSCHLCDDTSFYRLRLLFLLTALSIPCRRSAASSRAISILSLSLARSLREPGEPVGLTSESQFTILSRLTAEMVMEMLKVLFNITFDILRGDVDEEGMEQCSQLVSLLRTCLLTKADNEERTNEMHGHAVNLLTNLPPASLAGLAPPAPTSPSTPPLFEYNGRDMDVFEVLLAFMEIRLDRGEKLREGLTPVLAVLTEASRAHKDIRRPLRARVLPPLRDVRTRPEVGQTVRNKLVRLMTHMDSHVKRCAAEFLFALCRDNVSRFVKYTGYGNAAGLLAARGLLAGGKGDRQDDSTDEDSDTEEYLEARDRINPVTGRVEELTSDPFAGLTEEQKEEEASKLADMIDKLSRQRIFQPMSVGSDGKLQPLRREDYEDELDEGEE